MRACYTYGEAFLVRFQFRFPWSTDHLTLLVYPLSSTLDYSWYSEQPSPLFNMHSGVQFIVILTAGFLCTFVHCSPESYQWYMNIAIMHIRRVLLTVG